MTIVDYLDSVKSRLLTDPTIVLFRVVRQRQTLVDAHLRVRCTLIDQSGLEFSEYVHRSFNGQIVVTTYSYHWYNAQMDLIRRWDNTPHFPQLPGFPHHIHNGETNQVEPSTPMDIFFVLDEIHRQLVARGFPI